MCICNGVIFATNSSNEIWKTNINSISWIKVGTAYDVVSLSACGNKIYGANSSNEIWVTSANNINWVKIGSAYNVVGLAIPQ
jgi:hypothetical protein